MAHIQQDHSEKKFCRNKFILYLGFSCFQTGRGAVFMNSALRQDSADTKKKPDCLNGVFNYI